MVDKKGFINKNLKLSDFDFHLPEENVAYTQMPNREDSRLLLVPQLEDKFVHDLPELLSAGDLLIFNNTRVIPSRIKGLAARINKKIEITFHKQKTDHSWLGFCRGSKKLLIGDEILFTNDFKAIITEKQDESGVLFTFNKNSAETMAEFEKLGEMPLPPYIKRAQTKEDRENYQTVYAKHDGSVAAPTAGLHFTENLLARLKTKGVEFAFLTLHVGAGTFQPVKHEDLSQHIMHSEFGIITQETADQINKAKARGAKIIAVGTTSLRLLESAVNQETGQIEPFAAETDIFIMPGYKFQSANYLMTNFHLPKSTLLMLVSAFAGYEEMQSAYKYAIANNYRFYSYGDSSLLKLKS